MTILQTFNSVMDRNQYDIQLYRKRKSQTETYVDMSLEKICTGTTRHSPRYANPPQPPRAGEAVHRASQPVSEQTVNVRGHDNNLPRGQEVN
jgi:hypothetical protein